MSEKRSRQNIGDNDDNDDEESVRDSLDLDAETEAQQRRDMARIQAAWNQRVGLMQQTVESLQNPTVQRALEMIIALGLASPTDDLIGLLQMSMRDVEEKERQEEERRQRRLEGEEPVSYSPPSPRYEPPSPTSRSRNQSEAVRDMEALALRSQEDYAAGRTSFFFGNASYFGNSQNVVDLTEDIADDDVDEDEDIADDDVDEDEEEQIQEQAQIFSLYQPPRNNPSRHPSILERLEEAKAAREEKKAEPSPLSQVNVSSAGLFGSAAADSKQHPLHQLISDWNNSIMRRIDEERNVMHHHQHSAFDLDDMVPPPEDNDNDNDDDDNDDSSSSSSEEEDEDNE